MWLETDHKVCCKLLSLLLPDNNATKKINILFSATGGQNKKL